MKRDDVEISMDESSKKPREVAIEKSSGKSVVVEWEKMSKSKHNGVDPNLVTRSAVLKIGSNLNEDFSQILDKYGCDTTRLMMLCDVGPASDRNWSEDSYSRIRNMQVNQQTN